MPNASHSLMHYLRAIAGAWGEDPRDDAELLAHFVKSHDEDAFRVLAWRHGAMVWRTCQRILGATPDAEDAFQTVFLTLTRKASQLRSETLAGWLHRVARQASLNADASAKRRRNLERKIQNSIQPVTREDSGQTEQYKVLDEELNGLPEKLRVPLVLHFLEEKTQEEIARILGCTRCSVQRRLLKGEAVLRKQLERRGLTLGVGCIAALLGSKAGASAVPAGLIASTTRAAVAFRAGSLTGVTADAAQKMLQALAVQGTVRASWLAVLACVGLLGIGGASLVAWKMCIGVSDTARPEASGLSTTPKPVALKVITKTLDKRVDLYGDPLPEGALARIGTHRFRPSQMKEMSFGNYGIAFLPDGKTLLSLQGGYLYFWDITTGKELRRTDAIHSQGSIAVSPDGKVLATGGKYWDLTTDPPRQLQRESSPTGKVAFSPDGRMVAWVNTASNPGSYDIYLADAATGKVKKKLTEEKHPHDELHGVGDCHLAFSSDSRTLATGCTWSLPSDERHMGKTTLWDVATGAKKLQIPGDGSPVTFLAFLPDGRTLLETRRFANRHEFRCEDHMRFLDPDTGVERRQSGAVPGPNSFWTKNWVGKKCLSPDGKLLALLSQYAISIWDMETDREIGPDGLRHPVNRLLFSPDSKKLTTLALQRYLQLLSSCKII